MNCNSTSKSSSLQEYLNRCHLRALKHFPQVNEKCFPSDALDYDDDCLADYSSAGEKVKGMMQSKFRHSERENYCYPYKKSQKYSKRFRRKHFNENDDKLQEIVYLNQLANTVLSNDTSVNQAGVSNMDKRISKLLDQIQYEISKAKRKYTIAICRFPCGFAKCTDFFVVVCFWKQKLQLHWSMYSHRWLIYPISTVCFATGRYGNQWLHRVVTHTVW